MVTREQIKLEDLNILVGILDQRSKLLNFLINLGKNYFWNSSKNKQIPLFM